MCRQSRERRRTINIQRPLSSSHMPRMYAGLVTPSMSAIRIGNADSIQALRRVSAVSAISSRCARSYSRMELAMLLNTASNLSAVTAVDGDRRSKQCQFPYLVSGGDLFQCILDGDTQFMALHHLPEHLRNRLDALFHRQFERDRHGVADSQRTRDAVEIRRQLGYQGTGELADFPPQRRIENRGIKHGQRPAPPIRRRKWPTAATPSSGMPTRMT